MGRDTGSAQIANTLACVIALVGSQCQLPGRSGGMAMHHVERRLGLGMTVGLSQVTLHDQAVALLPPRKSTSALLWRWAMRGIGSVSGVVSEAGGGAI